MKEAVGDRDDVPDSLAVTEGVAVANADTLADVDPVLDPVKVPDGVAPLLNVGDCVAVPVVVRDPDRVAVLVTVLDPDALTPETVALGVAVASAVPLTVAPAEPLADAVAV